MYYNNKNTYCGYWKHDIIHGEGEFKWKRGHVYKGSWNNGKMNGYGEYTCPDGKTYCGQWTDGELKGFIKVKEDKIINYEYRKN